MSLIFFLNLKVYLNSSLAATYHGVIWTQLVSFRFEYRLPVPEHRNEQQQTCISPEPGVKAKRQWSQVGWMLTHHWNGLLSWSSYLILDSSVGLWVGIQSAGE